jgi:hypothetical protein
VWVTDDAQAGGGFDPLEALRRVHHAQIDGGYVRGPTATSPLAASIEHMAAHSSDACTEHPCRGLGLALVALELAMYTGQAKGGAHLLEFGEVVDAFDTALRRAGQVFVPSAVAFARNQFARYHEGEGLDPNRAYWHQQNHDLFCERPQRILRSLNTLLQELHEYAPALRAVLDHPVLHQRLRREGRPADTLLRAVSQHLDSGGFTYREIVLLIPDGAGTDMPSAMERVRNRVRSDDARSYYEPVKATTTVEDATGGVGSPPGNND